MQLDALKRGGQRIKQGPQRIVLDHCSISWATDEMIGAGSAYDLTVQWSIVSEGLDYMHYKNQKPYNGKGMLLGNSWYAERGDAIGRTSIHHNLWAHNSIRSPQATNSCPDAGRPEDCTVDLVNNYVYDWKYTGTHIANALGHSFTNAIGNVFRPGPSTNKKSMGLGMRDWTATSTGLRPGSRIEIFLADNWDELRDGRLRAARTECYRLRRKEERATEGARRLRDGCVRVRESLRGARHHDLARARTRAAAASRRRRERLPRRGRPLRSGAGRDRRPRDRAGPTGRRSRAVPRGGVSGVGLDADGGGSGGRRPGRHARRLGDAARARPRPSLIDAG